MDRNRAQTLWEAALGELQLQVTRANYDTWLKDTTGLDLREDKVVIGAPTAFATEWLEKRLGPLVRRTLAGILGREVHVQFLVHQDRSAAPAAADAGVPWGVAGGPPAPAPTAAGDTTAPPPPAAQLASAPLNPKYTFNKFIVGTSNQFAHAVAMRVAEEPGRSYNPLFLYGGVGLGKTHLLHAIGHTCQERAQRVLYVTSEQFTNEFITAIQRRTTEDFRAKYRSTDLLLIDDIQFLAGKEQTQESFFHIFNDLHNTNRQIVISSDRPPKSIHLLEDRLRSRFEWGLQADIQPPDFETRVAILRAKAEELGIQVAGPVLDSIAQKFHSNIRELEGALNRLVAYASLTRSGLTPTLADQALAEIAPAPERRQSVSTERVLEVTAAYFRTSPDDLRGPKRTKDLATARQVAMYLIREELRLPLAEIGRTIGGRDHTTVLHGCEKIAADLKRNTSLRRAVSDIRDLLYRAS
ncbi:MAG: chromosomal replication initiator protein DnaA [Chloroflexi bacterium]|nr:chromosomal replication initiator protein DnaA [Chloroflexota bacterium]